MLKDSKVQKDLLKSDLLKNFGFPNSDLVLSSIKLLNNKRKVGRVMENKTVFQLLWPFLSAKDISAVLCVSRKCSSFVSESALIYRHFFPSCTVAPNAHSPEVRSERIFYSKKSEKTNSSEQEWRSLFLERSELDMKVRDESGL